MQKYFKINLRWLKYVHKLKSISLSLLLSIFIYLNALIVQANSHYFTWLLLFVMCL
jgi:hypothetical protein